MTYSKVLGFSNDTKTPYSKSHENTEKDFPFIFNIFGDYLWSFINEELKVRQIE